MKKPNLQFDKHEGLIVTNKEDGYLGKKRISEAYEKMIDALIEAKTAIHHSICGLEWAEQERSQDFNEADAEHLIWLRKVEKNIEQALKAAGCHENK